jgi:hypothetical protein
MSAAARRRFLKQSAALAAALGSAGWHDPVAGQEPKPLADGPDLVLVNGVVYTVDDRLPRVEAFAVQNGRFVAVGKSEDIRRLASRRTQVIDAAGMTVVPGFIDAHTHPATAGIAELLEVDCNRSSIAEIQSAIRERAAKTPPGDWVLGFKYDDTKLKDGRPLHRKDLDAAAPRHPVKVQHRGGHTAIYNSLAFQLAGIDGKTPDPAGGRFARDDQGELTGFVAEKANEVFEKVGRRPAVAAAQRQAGVRLISELMTAAGLTSIHDASCSKASFIAYQDARAAGELRFRVYVMVQPDLFEALRLAGIRTGFGDERLRVGGIKLFCDGSASERTMRMSKPYVGRPNDFGILTLTPSRPVNRIPQLAGSGQGGGAGRCKLQ